MDIRKVLKQSPVDTPVLLRFRDEKRLKLKDLHAYLNSFKRYCDDAVYPYEKKILSGGGYVVYSETISPNPIVTENPKTGKDDVTLMVATHAWPYSPTKRFWEKCPSVSGENFDLNFDNNGDIDKIEIEFDGVYILPCNGDYIKDDFGTIELVVDEV